jgi:hypothetical protein
MLAHRFVGNGCNTYWKESKAKLMMLLGILHYVFAR